MALNRKMSKDYTEDEKQYIRRRIASYLKQGFSETNVLKRFNMYKTVYADICYGDPEVMGALNGRKSIMEKYKGTK